MPTATPEEMPIIIVASATANEPASALPANILQILQSAGARNTLTNAVLISSPAKAAMRDHMLARSDFGHADRFNLADTGFD